MSCNTGVAHGSLGLREHCNTETYSRKIEKYSAFWSEQGYQFYITGIFVTVKHNSYFLILQNVNTYSEHRNT